MDSYHLLEINLISAQDLKPLPGTRRMQCYAVAWVDPAAKVRTRTDRVGGESPTWNDRFIFRVPAAFLDRDSHSAVTVEIHASGGWYLPDSLVGTVRLLVGNHRLPDRPVDTPSFAAIGIRRPSGRIHGVLNVGSTLLSRVSALTAEALAGTPAVGYRDLMGESPRIRGRALPPPPSATKRGGGDAGKDPALRELNGVVRSVSGGGDGGKEGLERSDGQGVLCGLGFQRRIHLSPSDQNLNISWSDEGAKP